jgi:hypothetical protein
MTVHDIGGAGITCLSAFGYFPEITSDTTRFINCDTYNCCDSFHTDAAGTSALGNRADGIKADNEKGSYMYFEGCRTWNNSDDGIDLSGPCVGIYKNCWAFGMGKLDGDGNGFKSGGMRDSISVPGRIITNCLTAFNRMYGYHALDYAPYYRNNGRIYNNTSYANKIGFASFTNSVRPFFLDVYKNNISYKDGIIASIAYYWAPGYPESHNTWDFIFKGLPFNVNSDTVTVSDADLVSVIPNGLTGPRKADGSLPDIDFLKLANGSDLIDAGIDVGLPFLGKAPDMGAFEKK